MKDDESANKGKHRSDRTGSSRGVSMHLLQYELSYICEAWLGSREVWMSLPLFGSTQWLVSGDTSEKFVDPPRQRTAWRSKGDQRGGSE